MTTSRPDAAVPAGTRPSPPSPTEGREGSALRRVLALVALACFFSEVSWTGLAVAVPVVVRDLGASPMAATWLVLAPQLAATAFMIAFGRLADVLGRRNLFLGGVAAFTVASVLCGFAPNAWTLIAFEVMVAIASGAIVANGAAVLVDAFPADRLNHALGVYVASFSAAALLGPAVGGLIADTLGWPWLFWIGVPVGVVCCIWGRRVLVHVAPPPREHLDLAGLVLIPVGLMGIIFLLTRVGHWDLLGGPAIITGAVTLLSLTAFVAVERRAPHPIVDFAMFRHRPFALAMLSAFVNAMAQYSLPLLLVLLFQAAHGDSALHAGLKITPMSVVDGLVAVLAGSLARFGSPRTLALLGSGIAAAGIVMLRLTVHDSFLLTTVALVVTGAGVGIFLPSNANVVMTDAPDSRVGVTNAIRLTLQSIGGLLCTAICLTLLTSSLDPSVGRHFFAGDVARLSPEALPGLTAAYDRVMTLVAALAIIGTLAAGASWFYARHRSHRDVP